MPALNDKTIAKKRKVPSFLFAFWMCIPAINDIATSFLTSSIMVALYIVVFSLLVLYIAFSKNIRFRLMDRKSFALGIVLIICYAISFLVGVSDIQPQYFAVYFAIPMMIFPVLYQSDLFDLKLLLLYISVIPCVGIFFLKEIFIIDVYSTITMGTAYNFLTPILACMAFAMFFLKHQSRRFKLFYIVVLIINTVYLYEILKFGPRGPLLCIASLVFFALVFRFDYEKNLFIFTNWKFCVLAVLILIAIINIEPIFVTLNEYIDSSMLKKTIILMQDDNLLNNRADIYNNAFSLFLQKPIFGHGISSFEYYTGEGYPHNVILQMLFDNGVILTICMLLPLLIFFIRGRKNVNYNEFVFMLYLFSSAFIKGMVSGNIWENDKLWLLISLCLLFNSYRYLKAKKNSD